ncbi:MAG: amidohydrolase family protein, partial [Burkholderiales bacterium]|nr:amidohydrolase family protein [Burkholderiales bacterium]
MNFTTLCKRNLLSIACISVFACLPVDASTLIQHVRVFDGERMLPARHVLIDQGKIIDANYSGKINPEMRVVDGKDRTLLPGLIDAHVHAYQDQDLPLLFGVTSHIDMFSAVNVMQGVKKRMAEGKNKTAPDLFSAGTLATAPNGHGTEYGMTIETLVKPEEAQAWVDKRIAEGSDFIKIVMEHGGSSHSFNSLDVATVQALIKASHTRKKLAVVHISSFEDARAALAAGADGLVHLYNGAEISETQTNELIALAKKHNAFVIPTLSVLESIAGVHPDDVLQDGSVTALLSKSQLASLNLSYGKATKPELLVAPNKLSAAFHAAHVPVLAGTDAGNSGTMHGVSLHHEMAALVNAGLSPNAALAAATSAPAKAFRLSDRG